MANPVFNGLGNEIFGAFKETEQASLRPQASPAKDVDVIFVDRWEETDRNGAPIGVNGPRPTAWVKAVDYPQPKYEDEIDIAGRSYIIREFLPDGHQITRLTLEDVTDA